jgi:predicted phage replisome organizer
MAEVRWIKIVTDIFDDEKILLIEQLPENDTIIVIWFKLLCLAGKQNNSGVFTINDKIPYTEEMLSAIFRRPINTIRMALKFFEQYGMIEIINGVITIPNWGKHQNLDSIERKKEYMRTYMQEYRQKQLCKTNSKTNSKANVSRTDKDIDKKEIREDKNIDISTDKPSDTHPVRFIIPTLQEVTDYCSERKNSVDPQRFIDFYSSKGWMIGKNKMKDWKAAVRTWEKGNDRPDKPKNDLKGNKGFIQRTYSKEQLDALYDDIEEF